MLRLGQLRVSIFRLPSLELSSPGFVGVAQSWCPSREDCHQYGLNPAASRMARLTAALSMGTL